MNRANTIRRVMWGREEHPLTVFVPWDCGHHCPFCTTKREYETIYTAKRLEKNFACLKESLRRMLEYNFIDEVVFTGGEPLADVQRLDELIKQTRGQQIFINTSLNLDERKTEEAIRFLLRGRVDGISVSLPYANARMMNESGYRTLERLLTANVGSSYDWCRINSVVRGTETPEQIRMFLADISALRRIGDPRIWSVNLRKDYTTCDQGNLNDCFDPIMQTLMSMPDLHYIGHGGCLVCRNDVFGMEPETSDFHVPRLTYHRGVENTSLRYGDFLVINDFVIKPDGEIRYDWCPGTLLPKRVMDTLAKEPLHEAEPEWKWKNPLFAIKLTIGGDANASSCRDHIFERCG